MSTLTDGRTIVPLNEWIEQVKARGLKKCQFKCAACGNIQTGEDFEALGSDWQNVYSECIGRHTKEKGCDWALYGLFQIHKVAVLKEDGTHSPVFEFAE